MHLDVQKIKQIGRSRLPDLHSGPVTLGRSSENTVVLPDTHVSRRHCVIELVDGLPRVRDLESHGGTYVNGRRVDAAPLAEGDVLRIGPFEITFGSRQPSDGASPGPALNAGAALEVSPDGGIAIERISSRDHERLAQELAAARAELEQRNRHDAEQAAAQRARDAALNAQRLADAESDARAIAGLKSQIDHLRQGQADSRTHLEELEARVASLGQQLDEASAQLEERNAEVIRLMETLSSVRDQANQRQAEQERLHAREQQARDQLESMEQTHAIALARAARLENALRQVDEELASVQEASHQAAALQARVDLIQAAWVELEERLEENPDDQQQAEQLALQRHAMSTQLGEITDQRDDAVMALRQCAQRLSELVARNRPAEDHPGAQVVRSRALAAAGATPKPAEKRWRIFGRS